MASRLSLQSDLEILLGSDQVYFQPPASVRMTYPAIIYELQDIVNLHANDGVYAQFKRYQITVVDRNPDSLIPGRVSRLPRCRFDRHYEADNLHHSVFTITY